MAANIASVFIDLRAGVDNLKKDLDKSISRTRTQLNKMAKVVAAVLAAMAAGITAAIIKGARQIDALAKSVTKLGIEFTKDLQAMRLAAEKFSGMANTTFDTALQRMVRRVSEAAKGAGEAGNALKELNLDAEALARLDPAKQFEAIADAFGRVENQGDRVRLAMRIFDTEGVALVNTFQDGADAVREQLKFLDAVGASLTKMDTQAVEAMNDAFTDMKVVLGAVAQRFTVQIAPAITAGLIAVTNLAVGMGGFKKETQLAVDIIITGFLIAQQVTFGWLALLKQGEIALLSSAELILTIGKFAPTIKPIAMAMSLAGINAEAMGQAVAKAKEELDELVDKDPLKNFRINADKAREDTKNLMKAWADSMKKSGQEAATSFNAVVGAMENSITSLVTKGKLNFKGLVDTILSEAVRLTIAKPLIAALTGGAGGFLAGIFGAVGAKADGGPVSGGSPYIVGERGPELFVPNRTGLIVPNDVMNRGMARQSGENIAVENQNNFQLIPEATIQAQILQAAPMLVEATISELNDRRRRRF